MATMNSSRVDAQKDKPTVAIITVACASALVRQITEQANAMPWRTAYENSNEYFGPQSRPRWNLDTREASICIAVVDFDTDTNAALDSVEFLLQAFAGRISVVALTAEADPALLLRAMRAGCSEYLPKPVENRAFTEALARIERRFTSLQEASITLGTTLCFLGTKGGVGTTTLANHVATHLVVSHKKKVLLIDNANGLGHVSLYLGLETTHYSFRDLLKNVNRLDLDLLKGFVLHHSSGLDVIASSENQAPPAIMDPDEMRRTLNFLREQYEYVIVDCPAVLDDATMMIVDLSEQVYLITTPEIGSVRNLSRIVDGLLRYHQPKDKLLTVLNRFDSKGAMSTAQIEKASRLQVAKTIVNCNADLVKSANMGLPIPPEDKSEFTTQIREWGESLAGALAVEPPAPAKKRGLFWKSSQA